MRIGLVGALLVTAVPAAPKVGPVPKQLRKGLKLAPFYEKHVDATGLPVLGSKNVDDRALVAAAKLLDKLLEGRPKVRKAIIDAKVRFAVMAPTELTTDVPEHSDLRPKDYWDKRARGLGATAARPACSCGAENLLGLPGDRYRGESILIHEFSHTIHQLGLNKVDRKFEPRLKEIYARAMKKKLWHKTYAATNFIEYWAEGVQCYFDANLEANPPNGIHNHVNTRKELKQYDPELYELIAAVFKKAKWRWKDPAKKRRR